MLLFCKEKRIALDVRCLKIELEKGMEMKIFLYGIKTL